MLILSQHGSSGVIFMAIEHLSPPIPVVSLPPLSCAHALDIIVNTLKGGKGRWRNPGRSESRAFLAALQRYEWIYGAPAPEAMKRCAVNRIWWRALKATEACLVLSVFFFHSPRLQPSPLDTFPGSAAVPKEEKELIRSFSQSPLLGDDVKMCLALSCGDNYESYPSSRRYEQIYGPLPMLRCATSGVQTVEKRTGMEDIAGQM